MVSATSSRQASVNAGSSAWLARTGRTAAGPRISSSTGSPPGHNAGTPTRTPAARQTTRSAGAGTPDHGRRVRIGRKRARPYDGHGRHRPGSLLAVGAIRAFPARGCAASGCGDRHDADLLPGADGTFVRPPSSQRSAVQEHEEISKCRRC